MPFTLQQTMIQQDSNPNRLPSSVILHRVCGGRLWRLRSRLLALAPLGAPILEPDLDARLRQVEAHGELFAREHVRVLGLVEGALQLVQLVGGEGGARAAYLAAGSAVGVPLDLVLLVAAQFFATCFLLVLGWRVASVLFVGGGAGQREVIAVKTKIQLTNTLPIILNCVIGIIN